MISSLNSFETRLTRGTQKNRILVDSAFCCDALTKLAHCALGGIELTAARIIYLTGRVDNSSISPSFANDCFDPLVSMHDDPVIRLSASPHTSANGTG